MEPSTTPPAAESEKNPFDAEYKERFLEKLDDQPIILQEFAPKKTVSDFLDRHPMFYDSARLWWSWDKSLCAWKKIDDVDVLLAIDKTIQRAEMGKRMTQKTVKDEFLTILRFLSRERKPKEPKREWVQFGKKIYDVITGESFKATPEFFVVNPIPHELGTSEETPNIDKLFEEWVGKDQVRQLQEVFAYCCLPDYPIQVIFALIGAGNNGKTTCLNLLKRFVGESNCSTARLENLVMAGARFESSGLFKKLVCSMGETNIGIVRNTAYLKDLSGGDAITIEFKGKDIFTAHNYAKIIMATNNLPATTDKTAGFLRRWLIIEFSNSFEGKENRFPLKSITEEELRNFAKKESRILAEVMTAGHFTGEGSIEERSAKYEKISNPFASFLTAFFATEPDYSQTYPFTRLVNEYKEFCLKEKKRRLSATEVKRLLESEGWSIERIHVVDAEGRDTTMNAVVGLKKGDEKKDIGNIGNGVRISEGFSNLNADSVGSIANKTPIFPISLIPTSLMGLANARGTDTEYGIGDIGNIGALNPSPAANPLNPLTLFRPISSPEGVVKKAKFGEILRASGLDADNVIKTMLKIGLLEEPREGDLMEVRK